RGPELGRAAACGMIFNMIVISVCLSVPATAATLAAASRSLNDEDRFERHRPGHVVEVGRGRHHRLVERGELLLGAAALDADGVAQRLVAGRYRRIDAEEAAQIDVAVGLDLETFELDAAHRALCDVAHHHAGVERRQQVLLRIGEAVRSAELARLVDIDGELPRHALPADIEAVDLAATPGLALPARGDAPAGLALGGVAFDAVDQREHVVDIDAVHDVRLCGLRLGLGIHKKSPSFWIAADGISGAWRARPGCAGPAAR